jgi:o-succinylbenzoate synthase
MNASFCSYRLNFKTPGGTSRGILKEKESFFICIKEGENYGVGEVGLLRGLSMDDVPNLEDQISWTCRHIHLGLDELYEANKQFPSIQFALEQAFSHLIHGFDHFSNAFSKGQDALNINGLIWMGDIAFMQEQVAMRLSEGFKTLKMKVGSIAWEEEKSILSALRERFGPEELELRVDANGAFSLQQAVEISRYLGEIQVHSIEQPLKAGEDQELAKAARQMHIPIALDESLIGVVSRKDREILLDTVQPHYIILKPSFIGGWKGSEEWVKLAEERGIGWWVTSALESTIGLNAIAQWAFSKNNNIPQGLGTGSLYTNNIRGPFKVEMGQLKVKGNIQEGWDLSPIKSIL